MKLRRGVSLVELLIVMSLCSLLLTTSAVVLHRMMQSHGKAKDFLAVSRNGLRLAEQFRRDVHRARTVTTEGLPEGALLKLDAGDGRTIEYQQDGGVIRRAVLEGEKTVSREEFAFPANSQIAVSQQMMPPLVSLSVTNTPGDDEATSQPAFATAVLLRIDAQPNRERYSDAAATAEDSP